MKEAFLAARFERDIGSEQIGCVQVIQLLSALQMDLLSLQPFSGRDLLFMWLLT